MPVKKQCSKCGAEFGCSADGSGCWCEGYTIAPETLAELKAGYADCLCPACLEQYAKSENGSTLPRSV